MLTGAPRGFGARPGPSASPLRTLTPTLCLSWEESAVRSPAPRALLPPQLAGLLCVFFSNSPELLFCCQLLLCPEATL